MFNTSNPNNYEYITKHLELHILGGIKTNKLESMRITLSIQKLKHNNVLRHTLDLYNDNEVEKFVRKVAERLDRNLASAVEVESIPNIRSAASGLDGTPVPASRFMLNLWGPTRNC